MNLIADPTLSTLQTWKNEHPDCTLTVVFDTKWFVEFRRDGLPQAIVSGRTLSLALLMAARVLDKTLGLVPHVHSH